MGARMASLERKRQRQRRRSRRLEAAAYALDPLIITGVPHDGTVAILKRAVDRCMDEALWMYARELYENANLYGHTWDRETVAAMLTPRSHGSP